jgi:hypothetical protein
MPPSKFVPCLYEYKTRKGFAGNLQMNLKIINPHNTMVSGISNKELLWYNINTSGRSIRSISKNKSIALHLSEARCERSPFA